MSGFPRQTSVGKSKGKKTLNPSQNVTAVTGVNIEAMCGRTSQSQASSWMTKTGVKQAMTQTMSLTKPNTKNTSTFLVYEAMDSGPFCAPHSLLTRA